MIGREDGLRIYRTRVKVFQGLMFLLLSLVAVRLVFLQLIKGDELRRFSEANRLKKERLFPNRGVLFDRLGRVIVDNHAAFDVVLLSQYYSFKREVNQRLARALGMTLGELEKRLAKATKTASFYPILLKADASKDNIAAIEMDTEGFSGVDIEATVQRRYPFGDISAQVLGYIGEVSTREIQSNPQRFQMGDYIGKQGIEKKYDSILRGINGTGYVEVDAKGRRKKVEGVQGLLGFVAQDEPIAGHSLYLTLDLDLELAAREALKTRNFSGSVIAMDPRTGEILAMVNSPSYDPSLISGRGVDPKVWADLRNNPDRPLRNRAIQDHYPPGSTFKLFLAIAGLAEGKLNLHSETQCGGSIPFGNRRFNCWKRHGTVDFLRSIKESCDVYYYQLSQKLGVDTIAKYARLFGLGEVTGIPIFYEVKGNIPDTAWKKKVYGEVWHPGETLSVAIGQGYVDVTPIQLLIAYAAIGNGGFLYRPYLVRRIESRSGEIIRSFPPELARKIELPSEVFEQVKEGLWRVVNEPGGTAFLSKSKITQISGKTGTSQVRGFGDISKIRNCRDLPRADRHHAWFVGYAPKENPEIAAVAIAEHECHGSGSAPIVRDVIEKYFENKAERESKPVAMDKFISSPFEANATPFLEKKDTAKREISGKEDDE